MNSAQEKRQARRPGVLCRGAKSAEDTDPLATTERGAILLRVSDQTFSSSLKSFLGSRQFAAPFNPS
jgi:hypothetical protein